MIVCVRDCKWYYIVKEYCLSIIIFEIDFLKEVDNFFVFIEFDVVFYFIYFMSVSVGDFEEKEVKVV